MARERSRVAFEVAPSAKAGAAKPTAAADRAPWTISRRLTSDWGGTNAEENRVAPTARAIMVDWGFCAWKAAQAGVRELH